MLDKRRWLEAIKELRATQGISIFESEKVLAGEPEWRRWVERQINSDPQCREMALSHIRAHGDAALVVQRDGRFVVRQDSRGRESSAG